MARAPTSSLCVAGNLESLTGVVQKVRRGPEQVAYRLVPTLWEPKETTAAYMPVHPSISLDRDRPILALRQPRDLALRRVSLNAWEAMGQRIHPIP